MWSDSLRVLFRPFPSRAFLESDAQQSIMKDRAKFIYTLMIRKQILSVGASKPYKQQDEQLRLSNCSRALPEIYPMSTNIGRLTY